VAGLAICPDVKLSKRDRELMKTKFPACIGMFPECEKATEDNPSPDCGPTCPYWK